MSKWKIVNYSFVRIYLIVFDGTYMHAFSIQSFEIVLNSKQTMDKCDCVVGSFIFWWSGQYLFGILTTAQPSTFILLDIYHNNAINNYMLTMKPIGRF